MNADTFFAGSRAHRVCQDYTRAGRVLRRSYAIVSDGCSSSPDTDIGARFLTLAAARAIAKIPDRFYPAEIAAQAAIHVQPPLQPQCIDATLLIAREILDGVEVHVAGDGFVAGRRREDKRLIVFEVDFRNAPAYLSYLLDPERREAYLQQGFGDRMIRVWRLARSCQTDMVQESPMLVSVHHDNPFTGKVGPFFTCLFSKEEYDLVVLCTDGVSAFQQKDTLESIPFYKVLEYLTAFPSLTGEFVTRRVRRFVTQECAELRWVQSDDLGVGAICMESEDKGASSSSETR